MQTNYARPTVDEYVGGYNLDTELLAAYLAQAYAEALQDRINGKGAAPEGVWDSAWYRVAERAKELRA